MESTETLGISPARPINWKAALLAGLATGVLFALFPRANPWSTFTFFSGGIMGRTLAQGADPAFFGAFMIHLLVAGGYGLVIALFAHRFRHVGAMLVGAMIGLALYFVNRVVVSAYFPNWVGHESAVIFTHVMFGLINAAAYKGLVRRRERATM